LQERVIDALGLDASTRTQWSVDGVPFGDNEVHDLQMAWYADHPEFIVAALTRYGELVSILGLS
jgi:hypothetical protein